MPQSFVRRATDRCIPDIISAQDAERKSDEFIIAQSLVAALLLIALLRHLSRSLLRYSPNNFGEGRPRAPVKKSGGTKFLCPFYYFSGAAAPYNLFDN